MNDSIKKLFIVRSDVCIFALFTLFIALSRRDGATNKVKRERSFRFEEISHW